MRPGFALIWFLVANVFGPITQSAAQPTNARAARLPQRYLFVVETSRTMQRRSQGVYDTLKSLLDSSINGQLRQGDFVAIWSFNETVDTNRFPFQVWGAPAQASARSLLEEFLQPTAFEKRAGMDKLVARLNDLLASAELTTCILLTTGDDEIQGTPFDSQLKRAFSQCRSEQQKARMPVLTLLRASRGRFSQWSVTPAPWPLEIPPLGPEEVIVEARKSTASEPAKSVSPRDNRTATPDPHQTLANPTNLPGTRVLMGSSNKATNDLSTNSPAPAKAEVVVRNDAANTETPGTNAIPRSTTPLASTTDAKPGQALTRASSTNLPVSTGSPLPDPTEQKKPSDGPNLLKLTPVVLSASDQPESKPSRDSQPQAPSAPKLSPQPKPQSQQTETATISAQPTNRAVPAPETNQGIAFAADTPRRPDGTPTIVFARNRDPVDSPSSAQEPPGTPAPTPAPHVLSTTSIPAKLIPDVEKSSAEPTQQSAVIVQTDFLKDNAKWIVGAGASALASIVCLLLWLSTYSRNRINLITLPKSRAPVSK